MPTRVFALSLALCLGLIAACAPSNETTFRATPVAQVTNAPIYTDTPTRTPTIPPTETPLPTITPSLTPTLTPTPTLTLTPSPAPTQPLWTLTPVQIETWIAPIGVQAAPITAAEGWSCGDFPCGDDMAGWLRRLSVPPGFRVEAVGRFPGQPVQIAYGRDGRLYATVLEGGTRSGAVYALNADGSSERYAGDFVSPYGLAFQPGTDALYVSARVTLEQGGGVWRVDPDGAITPILTDLPCCYSSIDNQANGLTFGADGYLYVGVGALSDHGENARRTAQGVVNLNAYEASVLRVNPHTGAYEVYAAGIRNPVDVALDSAGSLYAADSGLLAGGGNRVLRLAAGAHFGFPYWIAYGCSTCWIKPAIIETTPDLAALPAMSLPRGVIAYTGSAYPRDLFDSLFVALWNGVEGGQRIARIDPVRAAADPAYTPQPFLTGMIRPADVTISPEGLIVAVDYVYGQVWRVVYAGN